MWSHRLHASQLSYTNKGDGKAIPGFLVMIMSFKSLMELLRLVRVVRLEIPSEVDISYGGL